MKKTDSIRIDGGKIQRSDDGNIRIKKSGSCLSIILMVGAVLSTLVAAFFSIRSASLLFDPTAGVYIWDVLMIFGVTLFLGFATYFLFRTYTRPPVIIDPLTRTVTVGKGKKELKISFDSIKNISVEEPPQIIMEGAGINKFVLVLDTGETVELCSISADKRKLPERVDRITELLTKAIGLPDSL
jgi:hypothetical protein